MLRGVNIAIVGLVMLSIGILVLWVLSNRTLVAEAQNLSCNDFQFQEDAQEVFDQDPSDPNGLDGPPGAASTGIPNVACEELPHRLAVLNSGGPSTGPVPIMPNGSCPREFPTMQRGVCYP